MGLYIGLDTSNYTTSAAAYDAGAGVMWQVKQPLPVRDGELGLRQSDAVFFHTRQLPEVLERLREDLGGRPMLLDGVAAPIVRGRRRGPICPASWPERDPPERLRP